jgi:molecular chaperone DnaK
VNPRLALIIATSDSEDPDLASLPAATHYAHELAEVLSDEARGHFEVEMHLNQSSATIRRAVDEMLSARERSDFALVYFYGHGLIDSDGQLYLAAVDTNPKFLTSTGISAQWLRARIAASSSERIVLILDCSFAGRIARVM